MRCYQARRRLISSCPDNSLQIDDPQLHDHLRLCPSCARFAEAELALRRDMAITSKPDSDFEVPLATFRRRVERRLALAVQPNQEEQTFMASITNSLRKKPRLGIGIATAVVVLLLGTLVPFTYDRTVGYEVAFAGVAPDVALDSEKIHDLLAKLGMEDAVVDVTDCDVKCNMKIGRLHSPEDAQLVLAAFHGWDAVEPDGELRTVSESSTGNVFELAHNGVRVIEFSSIGGSAQDIHRLLKERLGEEFDCNVFFFEDSATGEVNVDINVMAYADSNMMLGGDSAICRRIVIDGSGDSLNCFGNSFGWVSADGDSTIMEKMIVCGSPDGMAGGSQHMIELDGSDLDAEKIQQLRDQGFDVQITESPDGSTREINVVKIGDAVEPDGASAAKQGEAALPDGYELSQNYPNPFNPSTTISFSLPEAEHVSLDIINVNGQVVRTLVDEMMSSGEHVVEWNSESDSGDRVASGMYFYRLTAGDVVTTKKMTLLK